jgi:two-component system nitrate/nitrite sensor histidine kinase NarX
MFEGENWSDGLLTREKPGVLSFGGARMALLDIEAGFWGLRRQLEALVGGRLADAVLQQAGVNGGASFARSWIGNQAEIDAVSVLRECIAAYQAAGFGQFELQEVDWPIGRVRICATDTFEAWMVRRHEEKPSSPVCAYTAGVLVGFVDVISDRNDVVCVERTCQGQGAPACEFDLIPIEQAGDVPAVSVAPDPGLCRELNLLEILFDRMPMLIGVLDPEFRFRRLNPTWVQVAERYNPGSGGRFIPGADYFGLVPGAEPVVKPLFERVLAGETIRQDALRLEVAETVSYWDIVLAPLLGKGEVDGILIVGIDATARVNAMRELEETAQTLRKREERLALVMRATNDGIWDWDLRTDEVYYSPRWKTMLGYGVNEIPHSFEAWRSRLHPEDRDHALQAIQSYREGETGQYHLEHRLRHKDGTYRWILARGIAIRDAEGKPYRMLGSHTDITERKHAEEDLRETQRALATLMSNLPGMAYRCRNESGWPMEFVSQGSLGLTGYPPEALVDGAKIDYGDLVHPDDREMVWGEVQQAVAERRPFEITYRIRTASREEKWVWEQGRAVYPLQGEAHTLEGFITDVTERVMAQRFLEQRVEERTREIERRREVAEELRDILAVLNSRRSFEEILDYIVLEARNLLGAGAGVIYRALEDEGVILVDAASGAPQELVQLGNLPTYPEAVNWALLERKPYAVADFEQRVITDLTAGADGLNPVLVRWKEIVRAHYRAYLIIPLVIKDELYGALALYYPQPREFTEEDIGLGMALGDQVALAIENARLRDQVEQSAVLSERSRLARDLHDAVTQTLFSSSLIAEVIPRLLESHPEEGRKRLEELRQLTRGALAEMRTLLLELRPATLEEADLHELFPHLADAFQGRARIPVRLLIEGQCDIPAQVKIAFYRIAQEALNNVAKHAMAQEALLQVRCEDHYVEMLIADDGQGYDPSQVPADHMGLGIMKERAQDVGVELEINSEIGKGTRVSLIWKR